MSTIEWVERFSLALANARTLLSQAPRFPIDPAEASPMADAKEEAVKGGWYAIARNVSARAKIAKSLILWRTRHDSNV